MTTDRIGRAPEMNGDGDDGTEIRFTLTGTTTVQCRSWFDDKRCVLVEELFYPALDVTKRWENGVRVS